MLADIQSLPQIAELEEQLKALCEQHHILKLAIFGSMVRDDFRPDSDLDILVEFEFRDKCSSFFLSEGELSYDYF